jgi:hypothetical protein
MISKPMMINSSLRSAEGPKTYNRIASRISPAITQAIRRVVCVTVIMVYSPTPIFLSLALHGWRLRIFDPDPKRRNSSGNFAMFAASRAPSR